MSETPNLPAVEKSQAQKQRDRMDALMAAVEQRSDMLVTLLKETGISFEKFREVLRRAIIKGQEKPETNLLLAEAGSVIQACIDACTAGLLPDGRQGAIVIYNVNAAQRGEQKRWVKKAQFIPMYQGLLQIAYASRNFRDIQCRVVYEGDEFEYELGIEPRITHRPARREALATDDDGKVTGKRYAMTHAYAVAKTVDGGVFVEVFEPEDIRKVMAVSRAKSGPARDWPEEMARKGPLRRMWKFLPRNDRMDRVLTLDDEAYDLDKLDIPEEKGAPALKRGFAQIEQGANMTAPDMSRERDLVETPDDDPERGTPPVARERDDEPEPDVPGHEQTDGRPAAIAAYEARLDEAGTWLNIKQALRSLYKAEDWDRGEWEWTALDWAWQRKSAVEDRTDFVHDCYLFCCWMAGARPDHERVLENLDVLKTQADWRKALPETHSWVERLVREDGERGMGSDGA